MFSTTATNMFFCAKATTVKPDVID